MKLLDENGLTYYTGKIKDNVYTKQETYSKGEVDNLIPDLTDYVKNTDYASANTGGVIKTYSSNCFGVENGLPYGITKTYESYNNATQYIFINKGTLENVITGKDLTTKAYVDGLVGDIGTALDLINGESVGD